MRINESFSAPVSTGRADKNAPAGQQATTGATDGSAQDLVALSSAADLVSRALTSSSPDRAARVQALAQQVRAGTYNVSADALAHSLVTGLMRGL